MCGGVSLKMHQQMVLLVGLLCLAAIGTDAQQPTAERRIAQAGNGKEYLTVFGSDTSL